MCFNCNSLCVFGLQVGTHLVALAAAAAEIPMYVLADTSKITAGSLETFAHPGVTFGREEDEEKDAEEVVRGWPCGDASSLYDVAKSSLSVRNVYFEKTPLSLVRGVVTEQGILDAENVSEIVQGCRRNYLDAFQLQ